MSRRLLFIGGLVALAACGGGGSSAPTTPTATPTPVPSVSIAATGEGVLTLSPSRLATWAFALTTPIRIQETGGGTADWNFARFSILKSGREIERGELGSDALRTAGYSRIQARTNSIHTLTFRFNSMDFDDIAVTLGFGDVKDGRQFTVAVTDNWTDLNISFTPARLPGGSGEAR